MSIIRRNIALTATIIVTSILATTLSISFATLETSAFAFGVALLICAAAAVVIRRYRQQRFHQDRKEAMDAVEQMSISLQFFDKELPFCRYQRFQFARALDNAHRVGESLRDWITLVHMQLERKAIQHHGLQLKDVPSFVDNVSAQVKQAYQWVRDGGKGEAPKILDMFWLDESAICGEDLTLFPASRQSRRRHHDEDSYLKLSTAYPGLRSVIDPTCDRAEIDLTPGQPVYGQEIDFVEPPPVTTLRNATRPLVQVTGYATGGASRPLNSPGTNALTTRGLQRDDSSRGHGESAVLQFDQSKRRKNR